MHSNFPVYSPQKFHITYWVMSTPGPGGFLLLASIQLSGFFFLWFFFFFPLRYLPSVLCFGLLLPAWNAFSMSLSTFTCLIHEKSQFGGKSSLWTCSICEHVFIQHHQLYMTQDIKFNPKLFIYLVLWTIKIVNLPIMLGNVQFRSVPQISRVFGCHLRLLSTWKCG